MTAALPQPAPFPARVTLLGALVTAYVALLPYQFDIGNTMNFAPSDCVMLVVLVVAAGQLRYRKPAWSVWQFGIAATFITGWRNSRWKFRRSATVPRICWGSPSSF